MKEFAIKMWLPQRIYPNDVTEKGIHNAMLQGPAPLKKNVKTVPLVSTYFSNYSNGLVLNVAKQLIKNSKNDRVIKAFEEVNFIQAFRQPPNLLRTLGIFN